ncbi:MAG: leucyl-tRNA synthetase, leucyl-tRNA synthetase [Candidatus Saccharibacteria bacterium]|nr:leucyl-tRNA synthetase, leucyl-tRNA synthetase [Candidatus Saccharibacteria bacterium]
MKRYSPKDIESKWQKYWDDNQTYKADLNSSKPKYIGMSMFNYPSGAGIHIGHAMNYTISDVMARFKRQQGFESYHPVGWDAFGLPAENYAIKAGVSPQESMAKIIPDYHKQYKAMGWSNDWSKEIATHEPKYYKWSQWIFTQMHKHGLAYQDSRMQWWCEKDNTVLANEQVIDGKCWRHDGPEDPLVEKKEIKQWFFKITDYADELLEATDALDWTPSVKLAQKNWIGRSEGAEVTYKVQDSEHSITVFTTAYDTMYGTTFLVVAPEHELVPFLTDPEHLAEVEAYQKATFLKSELERQAEKEKTGVFTGAYAINPLSGRPVPVWIADYVLVGYGTGAVMGVPGEDERDYEFAQKFGLDIIYTTKQQEFVSDTDIKANPEKYIIANSEEFDGMTFLEGRPKILAKLVSVGAGVAKVNYRLRDWSVGRQRYWGAPIPIINCEKCGQVLVPEEDLPVVLPELKDFQPNGDGRSALARATEWLKVPCPQCGGEGERETDTLDTYICSSWYMLRYLDPDNDQAPFGSEVANKWMPVDFYNGADHATAHMIYARFVTRFFHKIGLLENPEPFKKFLYNGKVTAANGEMFSKSKGNGVDPLEIIAQGYGADALRTYLMFAAPLDLWVKWDPQGVPGTFRFINRVWNITQDFLEAKTTDENDEKVLQAIHPAIKKVTEDLETQKYNTAIATLMKATNDLYEYKAKTGIKSEKDWRFAAESLVMMMGPFAPHAAEELWHDLGHTDTLQRDHWPVYEEKYLTSNTMTIAIQVNGKLRGTISVASDASKEDIIAAASSDEKVKTYLVSEPKKTIYVPGKLVSFVV